MRGGLADRVCHKQQLHTDDNELPARPRAGVPVHPVIYGDPNLRVTPDTGYMHVVGTVIDTAHSDYGFDELEVQASSITI